MADTVIAGEYRGKAIIYMTYGKIQEPYIPLNFLGTKCVILNSETIESYEVQNNEQQKDTGSGIARGAVGGLLLGPLGMVAGAGMAKNKQTYRVIINFKDGKRSLVELNAKTFKALEVACF